MCLRLWFHFVNHDDAAQTTVDGIPEAEINEVRSWDGEAFLTPGSSLI